MELIDNLNKKNKKKNTNFIIVYKLWQTPANYLFIYITKQNNKKKKFY